VRILPIGDGVVLGEGASGGFRAPLEEMLLSAEIDFEFVGRQTENSFEMTFPNHEGWSRADLSYLREDILEPALAFIPQIILLYAGAEDIRHLPDSGIAVARLEKLIKAAISIAPDVSILCSQLIPSRDYAAEQKVKAFNTGLGSLVEKLCSKGVKVARLKMHAKVKADNLNEYGMPNELGYQQMALTWLPAIEEIYRRSLEVAQA
jgi:hypothetical protein